MIEPTAPAEQAHTTQRHLDVHASVGRPPITSKLIPKFTLKTLEHSRGRTSAASDAVLRAGGQHSPPLADRCGRGLGVQTKDLTVHLKRQAPAAHRSHAGGEGGGAGTIGKVLVP